MANIIKPHQDNGLNILRLLAIGAVGVYFYRTYKKEGSLLGATGKTHLNVDPEKIVDSVVDLTTLSDSHKHLLKIGAKKLINHI